VTEPTANAYSHLAASGASTQLYEVPFDDAAGGSVIMLNRNGEGRGAPSVYAVPRQNIPMNSSEDGYEVPLDDGSGESVIIVQPPEMYSTATNA
jgi:hypothetical protein